MNENEKNTPRPTTFFEIFKNIVTSADGHEKVSQNVWCTACSFFCDHDRISITVVIDESFVALLIDRLEKIDWLILRAEGEFE